MRSILETLSLFSLVDDGLLTGDVMVSRAYKWGDG